MGTSLLEIYKTIVGLKMADLNSLFIIIESAQDKWNLFIQEDMYEDFNSFLKSMKINNKETDLNEIKYKAAACLLSCLKVERIWLLADVIVDIKKGIDKEIIIGCIREILKRNETI